MTPASPELMLKERFRLACSAFCSDEHQINQSWEEIRVAYSEPHRAYHTLVHLAHLVRQLDKIKSLFSDVPAVEFAVFYHDFIYQPLAKDNEAVSAQVAAEKLIRLKVPQTTVGKCVELILATASHESGANHEVNLFTDADLGILGADEPAYLIYAENVRKEYAVFPDELYNPGRAQVLKKFLDMPRIFKTAEFSHLESQARVNLQQEIARLTRA